MFKKSFFFFGFRYVRMVNEVTVSLSKTIFEHQEAPTRYTLFEVLGKATRDRRYSAESAQLHGREC